MRHGWSQYTTMLSLSPVHYRNSSSSSSSSKFQSRRSVSGPSVWNKLPATLRISPTLGQFQSKLKAVLFRSAYET